MRLYFRLEREGRNPLFMEMGQLECLIRGTMKKQCTSKEERI
jgi:hypothetical protein